jgi:hypothetical protein
LLYAPALWSEKLAALPPKIRRIAPGHFALTRGLAEGSVVRGAVQVGENTLAFGPLSGVGGMSVRPGAAAQVAGNLRQSSGRGLLDLSWICPKLAEDTRRGARKRKAGTNH